jgi:hypothetical protein
MTRQNPDIESLQKELSGVCGKLSAITRFLNEGDVPDITPINRRVKLLLEMYERERREVKILRLYLEHRVDLCGRDGPARGVPAKIWAVGTLTSDGHWMPEAFHWLERDAVEAALAGQFICLCPIGQPLPAQATDAEQLYFPHLETWETSALYLARSGQIDTTPRGDVVGGKCS